MLSSYGRLAEDTRGRLALADVDVARCVHFRDLHLCAGDDDVTGARQRRQLSLGSGRCNSKGNML